MPSYSSPYHTVGGNLYDQGAATATAIGNKFKDNETIGGMVAGSFLDAARSQMNMGTALTYNTSMMSHAANLTQNLENLKTGNQMRLMSAEGRIAKDLIGFQGDQSRMNIRETGTEQRKGFRVQGEEQRKGIRETGSEQRKGLRVAGQEERLNIGKRYREERAMRADARGAIRSLGARFFG